MAALLVAPTVGTAETNPMREMMCAEVVVFTQHLTDVRDAGVSKESTLSVLADVINESETRGIMLAVVDAVYAVPDANRDTLASMVGYACLSAK